jgi:hypothetical protein
MLVRMNKHKPGAVHSQMLRYFVKRLVAHITHPYEQKVYDRIFMLNGIERKNKDSKGNIRYEDEQGSKIKQLLFPSNSARKLIGIFYDHK